MNKAKAKQHLATADKHLADGKQRIRKQEERVKRLAADGHATESAEKTLEYFKRLEKTMVKHRDLIRKELS